MRLQDLDNEQRICDSRQVRLSCALERGHGRSDIDDRTWRQYRQICNVPRSAKKLTRREVVLLLVCASLYREGAENLSGLKVVVEAEKRISSPRSVLLIDRFCGEEASLTGRELLEHLKAIGKPRSPKTLYRWGQQKGLPRFGLNQKYTPWQVRRWLTAV